MNEAQESTIAHAIIGFAQSKLADLDGVLPDDFHAATTAVIWHALELQLGGAEKVSVLINQRRE
jgi:hypothetical protein